MKKQEWKNRQNSETLLYSVTAIYKTNARLFTEAGINSNKY
ncbi:hypothetical protein HMPREF0663_12472 [Hoylesella oralis ATCC 33269]|uniref:Uncharacterized protein n=1 Tax=Hoylesella oralis ATCC 33269 TaxID=873533 RepID=E7RT54_9BACT|nr:hypothetical protein HMPREF0663_12472 [Hoylesella oralis ATCC 33269]